MKTKISLLYGGKSAEHQVSLRTALSVIQALDMEKYEVQPIYITEEGSWVKGPKLNAPLQDIKQLTFQNSGGNAQQALTAINESTIVTKDEEVLHVVFPLVHGPNGEDGTVQGMLELLNIPYVGNGVLSSSAGMDKVIMKNLFAQAGLPQVKYVSFIKYEWVNNEKSTYELTESEIGYPCFVKPANLGSSVGISKCNNRDELKQAFELAFQFDRKIIVEEGVRAREIELGVLGNDNPKCSVAGEIVPKTEFYDYKAKYEDGDTALIIPADISEEIYQKMCEMAIKAFKALDCSGLVRADFFLTEDNQILINEVNTMPGFTPMSMFPLLWKHSGLSYSQLIDELIELAKERYNIKQNIKYSF